MILLYTHIWVNWILLGCDALKPAIASAIEDADTVAVYAISCFEVALLVKGRKLEPPLSTIEWIKESLDESFKVCLPITCEIAQRSVKLTDVYRDPDDRIIIATALEHGARLASYDTAFPNYPELSDYFLTGQQA